MLEDELSIRLPPLIIFKIKAAPDFRTNSNFAQPNVRRRGEEEEIKQRGDEEDDREKERLGRNKI